MDSLARLRSRMDAFARTLHGGLRMKVRVTLMTSNDVPVSVLGDDPEEKAKQVWDIATAFLSAQGDDDIYVEKVEIVEGDE